MSREIFERAKREINLKDYIVATCPVEVEGNNGVWSIDPNPMDLQSKGNFKVSLKEGIWLYNAFNGEQGGTIVDFLEEKEGLKGSTLVEKLNNLLENNELLNKPIVIKEKEHRQEDINKFISLIDTTNVDYFRNRGISEEIIKNYQLGTCTNGISDMYSILKMNSHPKMKDHKNIIPCFDENKNLRFLVARNYKDKLLEVDKKTWNIKGMPTYFLNEFYIHGHNINKGDVILLCESWGDGLSAESVCNELRIVALHSTSGVKKLGNLLTMNREKFNNVKFIVAFNNDEPKADGQAPGQLATNKVIKIMKSLNIEYEVFMPTKHNDLNEWLLNDKEEFTKELNVIVDRLKYIHEIDFKEHSLDVFSKWTGGNLKYLINSNDDNKFAYWNGTAWEKRTEEEARLIYGDFIKCCRNQFKKNSSQGKFTPSDFATISRNINSWRSTSRMNECLNAIKIDVDSTINIKNYKLKYYIHVSANGKIIDLRKGEIRQTKKENMILETSPYKLIEREEAEKFMEDKILKTYRYTLGDDRLELLLDLLAMKMQGKNFQFAIFNIGPSKSGKSMLKNLITNLFTNGIAQVPYAYLTTAHKGNLGTERDDIIVNLDKKLFALSSESEKNQAPISIGRFKNILSNSITDARATGGRMQNGIDLTHLDIIIDTNEPPTFSGYDDAIENRLIFINWQNSIPMENRIDDFNGSVLLPNMDKVWSYFIYRAIDLGNKPLIIPEVIKRDSAERKAELDKFTMNVITRLEYVDGEFIDLDVLIKELDLFKVYPKLKNSRTIHKTLTDKIKIINGFENVIQDRRGKNKINIIRGLKLKNE